MFVCRMEGFASWHLSHPKWSWNFLIFKYQLSLSLSVLNWDTDPLYSEQGEPTAP